MKQAQLLELVETPLEGEELVNCLVDVVTMLDRAENYSLAEAVRIAAKRAGLSHPKLATPLKAIKCDSSAAVWGALNNVRSIRKAKRQ